MTVLGTGSGGSLLGAVVLSLDDMQFLLEKLEFDEMPVVLDAMGRYDNVTAHDAAMNVAQTALAERELLFGQVVAPELAERLRVLYRPQWIIALRWVVAGQVNRFCLAPGGGPDCGGGAGPGGGRARPPRPPPRGPPPTRWPPWPIGNRT
ncbi:ESX secretion-associated protein EspG, partial [Nocardia sp. NPDC058518]|uniref:ESX secretion-associated protein EspG n=1 Tax=Nocardia sp. NPDC058518 TaxID=3346534 RepID=UPI00364E7DD5